MVVIRVQFQTGVCLERWLPRGGLPRGESAQSPPPPVNRMTDRRFRKHYISPESETTLPTLCVPLKLGHYFGVFWIRLLFLRAGGDGSGHAADRGTPTSADGVWVQYEGRMFFVTWPLFEIFMGRLPPRKLTSFSLSIHDELLMAIITNSSTEYSLQVVI